MSGERIGRRADLDRRCAPVHRCAQDAVRLRRGRGRDGCRTSPGRRGTRRRRPRARGSRRRAGCRPPGALFSVLRPVKGTDVRYRTREPSGVSASEFTSWSGSSGPFSFTGTCAPSVVTEYSSKTSFVSRSAAKTTCRWSAENGPRTDPAIGREHGREREDVLAPVAGGAEELAALEGQPALADAVQHPLPRRIDAPSGDALDPARARGSRARPAADRSTRATAARRGRRPLVRSERPVMGGLRERDRLQEGATETDAILSTLAEQRGERTIRRSRPARARCPRRRRARVPGCAWP